MGFDFTNPNSWKNTFDPAKNGVNDSFKTAGQRSKTVSTQQKTGSATRSMSSLATKYGTQKKTESSRF
jgi:hypothetical protein